ncbi:transcription factor TFIIIB component B'' homolog isoform X2 [Sturnira hondurensis]|uniref:transcription factor TFIIIB component B'' homolog isoform X2 n=1 Tax=Sturnira hondurensis TaxID=192404 RepID=UPI0018795E18|nr:transcription factor TFIIIB component B'' homolog isoform X2 [Sturnira hondurensis]
MFRRARLSVKPNVRPGVGARSSITPIPQRGQEAPRPPEPAAARDPKPAEPTDVPLVDFEGAQPQEAPRSSDEKTDGKSDVEEPSKSSSTVSQRRKRISSTPTLVKPGVHVPPEPHPLSTVNQEAPQPNSVPAKEKQPCSDRYRIYKAQKLREMLKEELRKEKKQWKNKYAINESQRPPDRSKMTMRDFIYYLPDSNPMTYSLEQEKKTEKLTPVQAREQEDKSTPDDGDDEELDEEIDDGPLLVPRVKVAEDGSIILDEESLTVEVLRTKGPCVVEENDPIFERGSTTTYSSFRKNYYSKPWSNKETDMFFLAISMVGTDFSMIGQLFPHRARIEIKNKFKREEKTNGWRIDKAFQEKRPFDFNFFAHLLQKVLAEEEKRKQKSIKNQSLKEKKSSKPRKNVKVKKVASEGVNENPDESVNANLSGTKESQKDAQAIQEEQQPLTSSGQDSEQIALEPDLNQKKRRRKNQDEVGNQEVKSLSGNATVQPGPSKGEKQKNKCQSLSPEINEDEGNKKQTLSCVQNTSEVADLSSRDKVVKKTDTIFPSSSQEDVMSVATETSDSGSPDLHSSEVGIGALCEVNNVESSCTEERNVDLKNTSLETDQTENVKPMARGRFQKPKPNLSRAVGKKSVLSQGKTDAESKSLHSETSFEKIHMEKDKMNSFDISGMENTERKNSEADTIPNLSEKVGLREDDQPKAFRPARLMRGRLQRPKPNVGKASERREILAPQEEIGASVEKNECASCIDRDTPEQIDQSCKNFECEDITSQSEKRDTFQNVQPDEPMSLNECLSTQDHNKANILKQVPILKNRFQKPKPNIGRRTGRSEIFSKEDIVASGEKIAKLETAPREKVLVEANTAKETEAELQETGRRDVSPRKKVPEMSDLTVETETELKEMETDLKETGRESSPRREIPKVTGTTEEIETELEETGRRETSPQENALEDNTVGEVEAGLKETGGEIFPREKVPEVTYTTEEIGTELEETTSEIAFQENAPEDNTEEVEAGLKEIGGEISPREKVPEVSNATEEGETDLEETERREISAQEKSPGVKTIDELETDLKEIEKEISSREKEPAGMSAIGEREMNVKEPGRDISPMEMVSGKMAAIKVTEADLRETGKISWMENGSEEISDKEEMVADLQKTGKKDISLRENVPEDTGTLLQTETDLMPSSSADCCAVPSLNIENISSEVLFVVHTPVEEKRNCEKELPCQLSPLKTSSMISKLDKAEGQRTQPANVPEQCSDTNLSKSLPQEQKPFEVKPVPFMRSRFKRPKPNLSRAALKRETVEAEKHVPGKKLETDKMETVVLQQDGERMNTLPSHHEVSSLMTSREKDRPGHKQAEPVKLPCAQTEKNLLPSSSCDAKEESQSTQAQEKELLDSMGTDNITTFQQEMEESAVQTAQLVRGQLQRPIPNIKAGQRQVAEEGEAKGIVKEERTTVPRDETKKKFLTLPNSQIETEMEVVSSEVSEGGMCENQSHVAPEESYVDRINALNKKIRHEQKAYVSSPAQLVRRQFQKPKPNLGRAHGKIEEPGVEKERADQSEARKPEDNLLQQGDSDTNLLQKEEAELLTSLEVSARKDCIGSKEDGLVKKDAHSEVGPSGSVGQKTVGDNSLSSIIKEQCLSKLASHSQMLKESNYSKIALSRRTTLSSASGRETDRCVRRTHRKIRPNVTKGRGSKRARTKTSKKEPRTSKAMLVTLRASQEEDEDDVEDFESDFEEESYHLAPEEINKAPVFVPVGLRSPEPVPAQIEETMEELEITVNVPDIGFITVDEHQLSNTDATAQEMKQEENLNILSVEMTTGEHTQDETDTNNDGSAEAAITLLTMGDLVLQSEIGTEQSDGMCVLPGVHSKDKSHISFSPDHFSHEIVHECQELSLPVSSVPPSLEGNEIVLEEQCTKEETGLMETVKENAVSTRKTASKVTNNLRMRNRFAKPKPNLKKILGTNRFGAHQKVPSLFVTKGEEVEIQREMEKNVSKATGLEDKNLESFATEESKEHSPLAHVHGIEEISILQEAIIAERKEDQEQGSQEVQMLSFVPIVSSETSSHALGLGRGLGESSIGEPLRKDSDGDRMLTLCVPESTPTTIPELQQENAASPQDLTVNLVANEHHDGEDEQEFILTLVEIPTNAIEEFTDTATQLMPHPLLPAPILVKSVTAEEKGDNRKRFHCRLDESDVPPAKKCSLTSRDNCQKYTSEVCSKELINVFEETGKSYQGQDLFPTSESTHITPQPQKEKLEPTFQSIGSRPLDKIMDMHIEKNTPQLPQDKMIVSDKEERTCTASKSQQVDGITPASKTPLSRPGRRPLGFLSLICSKNSLESDAPTQVHSKKRLKPLIPVSRKNLKRSKPLSESQKKVEESSGLLSSPSVDNTQPENVGSSAAQVSCDCSLPKEERKSAQNQALEEESSTISEYFFNDIFIEVDETE